MEMPAMVEISLLENVTVNSTTPFVDATESGDFVLKTGSDIAEEPNRTQTSGDADPVAAAAETDSVETGGLLSKLAITIATGWLIY